jgi:hypothetical protein
LYARSIPKKYKTQLTELPYDLERSVYPFRALAAVLKGSRHVRDGRLRALDQGNFGSCIGFAGSRAADITAASDIMHRRERETWPTDDEDLPIITAPDYVYAASRDISGTLGRWQGSYGGAAAKALREYGAIHQRRYGRYNLAAYSISKAREWSAHGLPEPLIDEARKHPFLTTVRIENVEQAVALTQNGYGFLMCCSLAFKDERDADGFCRRIRPGWSHAQVAGLGYVSLNRVRQKWRGFMVQNSWGNSWPSGPLPFSDMPFGSYFIHYRDMAAAIAEGDCYALADYQGFRERYNFGEIGW